MKKMLVLTPEQWAHLHRGSQQISASEVKREKELTDYVKKLNLKNNATKPENFDRFQTLFHRFMADQKKARAPIRMSLTNEDDEWADIEDDDTDSPGGKSFVYNDDDDPPDTPPSRKRKAETPLDETTADPSWKSFSATKRKSIVSTPKPKRKRKAPGITPDKRSLKKGRLRSDPEWQEVPV